MLGGDSRIDRPAEAAPGDLSNSSADNRSEQARAGILIATAGLVARGVGWLRLVVIATLFGATPQLDAYFVAFRLPDAVFQLLAGGVLGSVLVPLMARRATDGGESAWRAVAGVANVLVIGIAVVSAVAAIAAPALVPLIAPGFTGEQLARTVDLTRVMLISPMCFSVGAVAASVLHYHGYFAASAVAPIVYSGVIIGATFVLGPTWGVMGVAVGVAAGAIGYLGVQLIALLAHTRYRHHATGLREPGVRRALVSLAPRSVGLAGTQLLFIVLTALASTLGTGAVTAFTIGFSLLLIPVGLVGVPIGTVIFGSLSRAAASGSVSEFRRSLLGALRLTLWASAGTTILAITLHRPLVETLFGFGALDAGTRDIVAATSVVLFLGIGAHSINLVAARAFYASHDTRTPVLLTLAQVVLTVAIALVAVEPLGLPGLALAIPVGSWLKAIALLALLSRGGVLDGRRLLLGMPGIVIVSVPAAAASALAAAIAMTLLGSNVDEVFGQLLVLVTGGGAGVAAFLAGSRLMGLPEAASAFQHARSAWRVRRMARTPSQRG